MMKKIEVFDPALCCSSGVCGTQVDDALVAFSTDVAWYKKQGGQLERYNLSQEPMKFVENKAVSDFLQRAGDACLPLIMMDNEMMLAGRYPSRTELSQWTGVDDSGKPEQQAPSCCSGEACC